MFFKHTSTPTIRLGLRANWRLVLINGFVGAMIAHKIRLHSSLNSDNILVAQSLEESP